MNVKKRLLCFKNFSIQLSLKTGEIIKCQEKCYQVPKWFKVFYAIYGIYILANILIIVFIFIDYIILSLLGILFIEYILLLIMPIKVIKCQPTPQLLLGYHHKVEI
ncbi:MAG: hypothetical protein KN64_14150 [Sulfurovum sp. AS07-7]|nr:MAG: hypothetical protein KN64_14090 [Sulfurovum sp. AS07-7]KIM02771.1 MAG: hypothetical protein KN64_14120 [Sulfurovum sp. AS07-7]KIM02775.1 MAG: hypothetical protein KN64_14150 [Sulfurovum sp. AS07-7]